MSHLVIERLADLADSEPLPDEREHLSACTMCSAELAAYRRIVAMAADEHRRIAPPLTDWGSLRSKLLSDGVIVTPAMSHAATTPGRRIFSATWRAAAMLIFVAGAMIFGRLSAGMPMQQALALGDLRFASTSDSGTNSRGMTGREFASTESALLALRRAQDEYNRAARYLSVNDTTAGEASPQIYRDQLAILDDMAKQSLRAIQERPQDPIMNQVYSTALSAREMTLTKLGATLSGGTRLVRY